MNIRLIQTDAEYETYLARVEELMGARPGTPEVEELKLLATLVEIYEDEHFPVPPPDPVDAVLFCLEQQGRPPSDLRDILGVSRGRLSEILNRRRRFSLEMIRTLSTELGIPAEILIQTEAAGAGERQATSEPKAGGGGETAGAPKRWTPNRLRRASLTNRAAPVRDLAPVHQRASTTLGVVQAHLRSDPNLDSEAADALSQMFAIAYEQFSKRHATPQEPSSEPFPNELSSDEGETSEGD